MSRADLVPPFYMAPMAGVTDAAFRARLRRHGCRRLATEMVSAAALARRNRRTLAYLAEPDQGDDLAIQLFGADPGELAEAAQLAGEAGFRRVDLNLGCPVRKVVRSGSGAALLRDPDRARRCIAALRRAVPGVLSVKLRLGWDEGSINCLEMGRIAEGEGVDWVALHARTRAQGYGGEADWSHVGRLARALALPVVGNGDVASAPEAVDRLREHGCAGIMVGRGALARPWLFREAAALWAGRPAPAPPSPLEIGQDLLRHAAELTAWKGDRVAVLEMRKFLAWGAKGLAGGAEFRRRIQGCQTLGDLAAEVSGFFGAPDDVEGEGERRRVGNG